MRSNKLALIAMLLCFVGGIGAAAAFAGKIGAVPQQTMTCSEQLGDDEQGDAADIAEAAEGVEQEAENQQGDDEQGDAQNPGDDSYEQGEDECGDDGGDD